MKQQLYKLHRKLSLIIALPVFLWASSGFMHPVMTNIRPQVATQLLPPLAIDSAHLRTDLATALQTHHIDSISRFRLVHIDTTWFYQVQLPGKPEPLYLSALTGKILTAGEWLYAQYLAREFLEGAAVADSTTAAAPAAAGSALHDCCDAATSCVLNNPKGAKVIDATLVTAFNPEYKEINRILPVYKVSFARKDGIRLYVETTQDRFAFAMDNKRAVFDTIFRYLHTWDWLDLLGRGKLLVIGAITALAFTTALLGIYLFFSTKSKKANGNGRVKARRWHRYTAIVAALFTLMWTFSGCYHALSKLKEDTRDRYFVTDHFAAAALHIPFDTLQQLVHAPVTNISAVQMNGSNYWQVYTKSAAVPAYINISNRQLLPEGDAQYARYLATRFSGNPQEEIVTTAPVTKFTDEYNFSDKRLPVWKIGYNKRRHERYYIETSTGKLSVRVDDSDLAEGYSFALFHKHHFMDWGGKTVRDISTMWWVFTQVVMISLGFVLYLVSRKKARR
ncbi:PepSY domain-containing protein [Chitinophaga agrisoli]|uniref:PepSY domain-containing protein n=1 Tax=Chitinophaga agrisoli TaxID=2607653 RepID=A0A5B2VTL4_9BACT|nr:PepSY-associated TM helix domain-containing protein [Chitinophaga agrisoli]KAA2242551.1 PepSY domain-containing protein [Chitinophaga agrisoli]